MGIDREDLVFLAACGGGAATVARGAAEGDGGAAATVGATTSGGPGAGVPGAGGRVGMGIFALKHAATQVGSLKESATVANGVAVVRRDAGINGPGGDLVAAIQDKKNTVKLWNWKKEQPALTCTSPEKLCALCASTGGDFILGGGESGACYLWETSSGALLRVWKAHYRGLSALRFVEGDLNLITAGKDAIAHVWDVADLLDARVTTPRPMFTFSDHSLPITQLWSGHFGSDCRVLSCAQDQTLKAWFMPPKDFRGSALIRSFVFPTALLCVTADKMETMAFVGGEDAKIYEVPLRAGAREDENMLSTRPGKRRKRDASSGASATYRMLEGHLGPVSCIELSTAGTLLVSGSLDGTCRLWDTLSGQALKVVRMNEASKPIVALVSMPMPAEIARGHGANVLKTAAMAKSATVPPVRPLLRYQAAPGADNAKAVVQIRTSNLRTPPIATAALNAPLDLVSTSQTHIVVQSGKADDTFAGSNGQAHAEVAAPASENASRKPSASLGEQAESARWKRVSAQLYTTAVSQFLEEQLST
ncbi:WD repeat-containing protein 18 [Hondaea fermentalgiana]|uniref:WD repeat-containing protein 18 n=1 Tax=Hondaea fermentalgiana TaxID=2315210 RepID=A0A2R5GDQ7_9STRA|nr:WD repeat-containing protein 18 [Hondaea fermentalgiana]|eukprot:GBG28695.1 WD repeat-containing protein 18 [Hondaea fermentalgiana]